MESGENENPTLDTLKKVAKALDVSVDELIK
jgi:transcriptional regulator with XRE-family HTH domain